MAEETQNVFATEQPRSSDGRFTTAEPRPGKMPDVGKMRMNDVLDLTSPDQHKVYEEAHEREQAAQARKAKQAQPIDLDKKLRELKARELGLGSLDDDVSPEDWAKNRNAQLAAGTVPRLTPLDESGEPIGEPEAPTEAEPEASWVGASLGIAADHPHVERMKELHDWYGEQHFARLAEAAKNVPMTPGLMRQIANLDNSADVIVALVNRPDVANTLCSLAPNQAKTALQELSGVVAGQQVEQPKPKQPKPKPPEPVTARASTAFDPNDDGMSADEWARRRNEQVRQRRGY